jgi:ATP synthase subunit G
MSEDDGFKQLLAAEEKAKEKVAAVRKERQQLLKRAEDEAQADIDAYKAQRQAAYDSKVKEHSGLTDERSRQLLVQAQHEKDLVASNAARNKAAVIDMLVNAATHVDA